MEEDEKGPLSSSILKNYLAGWSIIKMLINLENILPIMK